MVLIFFYTCVSFGQPDSVLRKLFYGLDLRLSAQINGQLLAADSNFLPPQEAIISGDRMIYVPSFNIAYSFYGKVLHKGAVGPQTDSTLIYITSDIGITFCNDCSGIDTISISYSCIRTHLEYYYHTADSLEKAYNQVLSLLLFYGKKLSDEKNHYNEPYKNTLFENAYLVDEKTLAVIKRNRRSINWPSLSVKKNYQKKYSSLEIEYKRNQVKE